MREAHIGALADGFADLLLGGGKVPFTERDDTQRVAGSGELGLLVERRLQLLARLRVLLAIDEDLRELITDLRVARVELEEAPVPDERLVILPSRRYAFAMLTTAMS